jgi:hypothetical protein
VVWAGTLARDLSQHDYSRVAAIAADEVQIHGRRQPAKLTKTSPTGSVFLKRAPANPHSAKRQDLLFTSKTTPPIARMAPARGP